MPDSLAPGLPATVPAHDLTVSEPTELHDTNQRGNAGASILFRLGVVPDRDYRLELRVPEATDGRPANVSFFVLRGYVPYFDLGDENELPGAMLYNFWLVDDHKNGDLSIEFKAPRFHEVEGRNISARLLVAFELGEYHFEPGDVYTVVLTDITDSGDDYLGAEETTGTVAVGGSVTGNLEVDNDVDWFKVRLEEGKSYRIRMRGAESGGGTLADPTVVVGTIASVIAGYYGFGAPPPFNDDKSTTEKDSELVVPVFTTHDAYIHAATSGTGTGTGTYTIEVEEVTTSMGQRANSPATGGPGITGTVRAGETLTATTDGIEDEDGLTGSVFSYQWVRSGADIKGAASSTYTMTDDDEGKAIQVRVTFSDDAGNEESLTSYARLSAPPLTIRDAGVIASNTPATGEPTITGTAQVGETLTADTTDISDSDGLINASFTYRWLASDGTSDSDISGASSSTYTPVASDEGKTITMRVSFTDDRGHQETLTSTATAAVAASPPNSVATGAPAISGTVQVAQTLTASTSDISDSDGLTNPTFTYQWLADDADITDATGSTYTLAAADEGKTIKVRVSFTDDRGQQETLTSTATATVASAPSPSYCRHPRRAGLARRDDGLHLRAAVQRGSQGRLQLQDAAGPCVHGRGMHGGRGPAAGQRQQLPLGCHRRTGLQRGRHRRVARHRGLRRAGGHLRRRRQEAVQPAGAHRVPSGQLDPAALRRHAWAIRRAMEEMAQREAGLSK